MIYGGTESDRHFHFFWSLQFIMNKGTTEFSSGLCKCSCWLHQIGPAYHLERIKPQLQTSFLNQKTERVLNKCKNFPFKWKLCYINTKQITKSLTIWIIWFRTLVTIHSCQEVIIQEYTVQVLVTDPALHRAAPMPPRTGGGARVTSTAFAS